MTVPDRINTVVIVGGGTAGWLTAGLLAAEHRPGGESGLGVVLIESPDVSPIGVGEGTWPTMRTSLQAMGISETEFIRECNASFKQGTRFNGWLQGQDEFYYHPFALPQRFHEIDLARHWQPLRGQVSYADAVTPQGRACERALAPKQITTPEYASNLNYGYHLDAGKFSKFLEHHCVEKLGVQHILDNVVEINSAENGDIASLSCQSGERIQGDLFVDCTGFAALLLGKHFAIPFRSMQNFLFNDRALAMQVPRNSSSEAIASTTQATAQGSGWVWDIALPERRGVGHVYSSLHTSDEQAESDLRRYLAATASAELSESCTPRQIRFSPGHREKLWHRNCVAIGLSGGFVEPLEASALVMIELSATMLSEQLPANRSVMDIVAGRFNDKFLYHWRRIIEFLKLHYVLSQRRDTDYWRDNCSAETVPPALQDSLELWRYRSPRYQDLPLADELFPAASYRYVLYGMNFESEGPSKQRRSDSSTRATAESLFSDNVKLTAQLLKALPTNRELIEKVHEFGFQNLNPATIGAMMANNYVMLNNVEHQNLKVITDRSARYGDDVDFAPTFPLEFRRIQSFYPIFFRKDASTGQFSPIALFGFQPGENLYLSDSGWDAPYVPLMIMRHPFLIGLQQAQGERDTRQAVVSIDLNSPRVNESEGKALFLEHGGISDYLTSITEMLETIRLASEMSTGFVDAILELDLIESVTMQIELKDGSKHELLGYYTINEEKLQQLDSEALGKLHANNYLESIFMVLASLSNVRTLVEKKNEQLPGV